MPAVEQCPHRDNVQITGDGDESAHCGLLERIVACGQDLDTFRVPRQACEACIGGIPPSRERLNPVLASFLFSAATDIIERGGVGTCTAGRAGELKDWARTSVEIEGTGGAIPSQPRSWRDCCHLGGIAGYRQHPAPRGMIHTAVHQCHHPAHDLTTEAECADCRDWSRSPSRPVLLSELLPRPASWRSTGPIRWAVGMTTAPRQIPTVERSLDYLRRAGWNEVHLAVDGSTALPPTAASDDVCLRTPGIGAWPNYYLTLLELVLSNPRADAFMVVQDDAQFYDRENVRSYLESLLWPTDPPGILSLYCSAAYTQPSPGWSIADQRWEWGALAFVFPAELARRFVCDPEVIAHRRTDRGLRYIDDVIGLWARREAIPIWHPTPSLVQHIGRTSTVWPGIPAAGFRRADSFAGEL